MYNLNLEEENLANNSLPSNKNFGLFFSVVFLLLAVYLYFYLNLMPIAFLFLSLTLFFIISSYFFPTFLSPLNFLWFQIGIFLGKVISPIILALIFFLILTPVGLFMKLLGRDELRLKKINSVTYWKKPINSPFDSESFKNQF